MDFHKSKGNIGSFETDINKIFVSHVFTYSKNKETDAKYYIVYENDNNINPIQDGSFWDCSRMGKEHKGLPSLKFVTHILQ